MQATAFGVLPHKDFLSIPQLSPAEVGRVFDVAAELKRGRNEYTDLLAGKRLAMIFEKDSLRTRFTFDVGMRDMGGQAVFMDHRDARIGSRENLGDVAKNIERWMDGIVARTFRHHVVEELSANCSIPVINGLTDFNHPCQGLTDWFTLTEKWGDVAGKTLTYVGDGNNTCVSLIHAASKLGANIRVCTPKGYEPDAAVVEEAQRQAATTGSEVSLLHDPREACDGVDAVYTDVWASMGQEGETEERAAVFAGYQVNEELMTTADKDAFFMHCLPAHRGHEVTTGVMEGPASIVFDNAENRLHVQKALLVLLMGEEVSS